MSMGPPACPSAARALIKPVPRSKESKRRFQVHCMYRDEKHGSAISAARAAAPSAGSDTFTAAPPMFRVAESSSPRSSTVEYK